MSLTERYPVLDRKANLLRAVRGLPPKTERGFYDPSLDRPLLYRLPRRARFWPGSDTLAGDEWRYWYGDIAIPDELNTPHRRPSCLQDEAELNRQLRAQLFGSSSSSSSSRLESSSSQLQQSSSQLQQSSSSQLQQFSSRQLRSSSVSRLESSRRSMERDTRALRSSSVSRAVAAPTYEDLYGDIEIPEPLLRPRPRPSSLQEYEEPAVPAASTAALKASEADIEQRTAASQAALQYLRSVRQASVQRTSVSSEETSMTSSRRKASSRSRQQLTAGSSSVQPESQFLGLDGVPVYVPRWIQNHPIPEEPNRRQPPPGSEWPSRRPFYDLKNDYDTMLSFLGVTKDLRKAVSSY